MEEHARVRTRSSASCAPHSQSPRKVRFFKDNTVVKMSKSKLLLLVKGKTDI